MKKTLVVVAVIVVLLLIAVGVVYAQEGEFGVLITTEPTAVAVDQDDNPLWFLYSDADPLEVLWIPDPNANSYWVSMWDFDIFTGVPGNVLQAGHHWAENPNGTTYTFGGYTPGVCSNCVYIIAVFSEIGFKYYDPATDTYEYEYVLLEDSPVQFSWPFQFYR